MYKVSPRFGLRAAALPALLLAAGGISPGVAAAQAATPPERATTIVVYGDDPCPQSDEEEIVICARKPEGERYRIPKDLRKAPPSAAENSWGSRVETLEELARATRPDGCSVVGSMGQTGCFAAELREWRAARQSMKHE